MIFEDTLTGWNDWSWSCSTTYGISSPVYSGSNSVKVEITSAWGAYSLSKQSGSASTAGYTNFTFYIHGGTSGGQALRLYVEDSGGAKTTVMVNNYVPGGSVSANVWEKVIVPFTALGAVNCNVVRISLQGDPGTALPAFYLDKIQYE